MNLKSGFAIATLLLSTGLTFPFKALAFYPSHNSTTSVELKSAEPNSTLIASDFDDYRRRRHTELEQQMRNEMGKPYNRNLSQREKERIIKDAHQALDDHLDREKEDWEERQRERQDRYYDSYQRDNRYDRNDRNPNPYEQYNRNNRYDRYNRYNR